MKLSAAVVASCVGSGLLVPVLFPQLTGGKSKHQLETPDSVPPGLQDNCRRVILQCGLNPNNISIYISDSYSSFSRGWRRNAVLGLSCRYQLLHNPDHHLHMTIGGKRLDWQSEEGKQIREIVQPSLEELQFTLAHEIGHLRLYHHFTASLVVPFFLLSAHKVSLLAVNQVVSKLKQLLIRCGVYSTFAILLFCSLIGIRRMLEFSADSYAASQNVEYALGGISMMEKQLQLEAITLQMLPGQQHQYNNWLTLHPSYNSRICRLKRTMEDKYRDYRNI
ncbi:transmembrane protein 177-like [Corticium candelabrum]|uniref:transmembrane protein 177-like n=1 Tax=Corticium candelabrum TaxID=121492 RepID=UPI002E25C789|nr:transmembrane protein 177-like [Corticium candelabrum]